MRVLSTLILAGFISLGCAQAQEHKHTEQTPSGKTIEFSKKPHDEPRPYDGDRNAIADVDAALAQAKLRGTKALIVMGANWCHDSRAMAGRLQLPEFQTLIQDQYETVYVSAGTIPRQNDQNRDVSQRFGIDQIAGTPTIFIVDSDGTVLNGESAEYWRRAESVPVDMSYAYLAHYAKK